MSSSSSSNFLDNIKGFCIDINGVLYNCGVDQPIEGSIDAIEQLKRHSLPFLLLTNQTTLDLISFTKFLNSIGFNQTPETIIAPAPQVAIYLEQNNLRPFLLTFPEVNGDFSHLDQSNPNCVVVGDAVQHFTYENMNRAFQILMDNQDAPLIAMGRSKYYLDNGKFVLDQGAFVTGLEYAADRTAIIIGKPSANYFELALKQLDLKPEQVAMIGDDIRSDVGAAQSIGMKGILVRSGKYRRETDENHATIKPDLIVDNLAQLVDKLLTTR
ncbi:phospholysine phosphohistidine inorganic pyrophosphate phosphatase-like [Panonychus citri]|uniref:phospholysine phosphohistidine inorganic pyrophosphate phosphatase-like n=1 Tax=Panonychus citri TaxID=50023 RepID=UPI0023074E32|nr:phospholysine phosphohistidine inorganic pyrophosphate phosphatase-like [Panonychus citri]